MLSINNFKDLTKVDNLLRECWSEAETYALDNSVFGDVYSVGTDDKEITTDSGISGVEKIEEIAEGAQFPDLNSSELYSVQYEQKNNGGMIRVTDRMMRFEQYGKMASLPSDLIKKTYKKLQLDLADVLINGFSAAAYNRRSDGKTITPNSPDGVAMFNIAHPCANSAGDTYNNIITDGTTVNMDLDEDSLNAVEEYMAPRMLDHSGTLEVPEFKYLIVPRRLTSTARILLKSTGRVSATFSSGVYNPVEDQYKLIVWDWLDNVTYPNCWFVLDPSLNPLNLIWAKKPELDPQYVDYHTKNLEYTSFSYYAYGDGGMTKIGLVGSKGTNVA